MLGAPWHGLSAPWHGLALVRWYRSACCSARGGPAVSAQRKAHAGDDPVPRSRLSRGIIDIEAMHHAARAFEIAAAVKGLAAHDAGDREKPIAHPVVIEILEIRFQVPRKIRARRLMFLVRQRVDAHVGTAVGGAEAAPVADRRRTLPHGKQIRGESD